MKHRTLYSFIFASFILLSASAIQCSDTSNEGIIFFKGNSSQDSFDDLAAATKNNSKFPQSPNGTSKLTPFSSSIASSNNARSPQAVLFIDDNADGYFAPAFVQFTAGTPVEHAIPLHQRFEAACMNNDTNAVDGIIKVDKYLRQTTTSSLITQRNQYDHDPLYAAARAGYVATVSTLIQHGADVQSKNGQNRKTPFCAAIQHGYRDVVQTILEEKSKIQLINSPCDKSSRSPLHIANQDFHMTNLLLMEDGADIHVRDNDGKKPYHANLPADVKDLYDQKKVYDRDRQNEELSQMTSEDKRSQHLRNFNKPVEVKVSRHFMAKFIPSFMQSKR